MNVLLVSHAFPPVNVIGAVRVGKFAKYLHEAGHGVRVVAATSSNAALPLEIPPEYVAYAQGWARDELFDGAVKLVRRVWSKTRTGSTAEAPAAAPAAAPPRTASSPRLVRHYYALLRIPDARAGWIGAATAAGLEVVRDWRPDNVVGSDPPNSGLVAASRIARSCGAPRIAELRDLWVDNPYYDNLA